MVALRRNRRKVLDSIIYEFNQSKAIAIYEKYLADVITPKIPVGAAVIHGHMILVKKLTISIYLARCKRCEISLKIGFI
jgi:hypothetical protein